MVASRHVLQSAAAIGPYSMCGRGVGAMRRVDNFSSTVTLNPGEGLGHHPEVMCERATLLAQPKYRFA